MSIERVRAFFASHGLADRVMEFDASSATVDEAARAVGVEPARIAKTLSFRDGEGCLLVVAAGDAKVDNAKYKGQFQTKAKMLSPEDALAMTGYAVGGVCPFVLPETVAVYLDASLQRFDAVYPACGSSHSAVRVTLEELESLSGAKAWVDVCKGWSETDESDG